MRFECFINTEKTISNEKLSFRLQISSLVRQIAATVAVKLPI
ncbi:hypothetical protein JCM19238_5272 [Vibrio ponticus]|nr:hypothetical protein JCM19238_5272 [Vibrio ponticus]